MSTLVQKNYDYHYRAYLSSIIDLVGTVLVKSEYQALEMNSALRLRKRDLDAVNEFDRATWPYYLNISGEYHPDDEKMYVVSMDTTERILFSKETLSEHKNTRKEYSYGSHKYLELIERYPQNELLIKGILFPVNINKAIDSKDGTILSYDKSKVEINEYSLIDNLQDWVYGYFKRWYQAQYNINNRYYNTAFMGILYSKMVEAIMTLRLEACLTNEAHSYHVRRYLASHDFLDYYMDQLTVKQSLRLYKNIRWVKRYAGHAKTQKWLMDVLLTSRHLPLAEYDMVHSYKEIPENIYAKPVFHKRSLNKLETIIPEVDNLSLYSILNKEDNLAPDNVNEREALEKIAERDLRGSLSAEVKTKILESKVLDFDNSEVVTLDAVLIDTWIDMVVRNLYHAYVLIKNPVTGESIPLSAKDALILITYCITRLQGVKDDCIPSFIIGHSIPENKPTRTHLEKYVADKSLMEEDWYKLLLDKYQGLYRITAIEDFYTQAYRIFKDINELIHEVAKEEHMDVRAYKEAQVYALYDVKTVNIVPEGTHFKPYLSSIGINLENATIDDLTHLVHEVWMKATGLDNVKTQSLRNVQKAMVQLMAQLSSYSVHYIREINDSSIIPTHMKSIRQQGLPKLKGLATRDEKLKQPEVIDHLVSGRQIIEREGDGVRSNIVVKGKHSAFAETGLKNLSTSIHYHSTDIIRVGCQCYVECDDLSGLENPFHLPAIPGMRSWLETPEEIRNKVASQWCNTNEWKENEANKDVPKEPIDWNIRNDDLDGLDYTQPYPEPY